MVCLEQIFFQEQDLLQHLLSCSMSTRFKNSTTLVTVSDKGSSGHIGQRQLADAHWQSFCIKSY